MLIWERYHNNNEGDWPIRPDGFAGEPVVSSFCFLLDTDTGDGTKELLLDTSTAGVDEYCLQLDTSS